MRHMTSKLAAIVGLLVAATLSTAQQCADRNWSTKFDQITNPEVIAKLKATNWDLAIEQAGGPEQIIASLKVTRKDAVQRLAAADRAAEATQATGGPVVYDATWESCRDGGGNAYGAAKCEHLNMTEMILTLDGTIELVKCRE